MDQDQAKDQEQDQKLLHRTAHARKGDSRAWGDLIAAHEDRVKAAALRFLGEQRGDIHLEDVLQETFLRAFKSVETSSWQGEESFLRWLVGIASNVVHEMAKQRKRCPLIRIQGDVAR